MRVARERMVNAVRQIRHRNAPPGAGNKMERVAVDEVLRERPDNRADRNAYEQADGVEPEMHAPDDQRKGDCRVHGCYDGRVRRRQHFEELPVEQPRVAVRGLRPVMDKDTDRADDGHPARGEALKNSRPLGPRCHVATLTHPPSASCAHACCRTAPWPYPSFEFQLEDATVKRSEALRRQAATERTTRREQPAPQRTHR